MTAQLLPDGRWVVPGNRWDLVPVEDDRRTEVTVVIPYFRQQRLLELVLTGLTLQTHPVSRLQVVVADDGSPEPPDVGGFTDRLGITVVRQADHGFRAAAARNLGASAADGSILCFLDADTVPEPSYVENAAALPAALPDALVVGRRRHADLADWSAAQLGSWFTDRTPPPPRELTEPRWLIDAYAGSRDLLDADRRSYRHVISAVMTCTRALFDEIGGFDESFSAYGGEDWEFAHRAFDAGAVFAHRRDAVAWHDGPDWGERDDDDRAAKNTEAMALSSRITDPAARTHGLVYAIPEVIAVVGTDGHSAASLLVTAGSVVSAGDCHVWIDGPDAAAIRTVWGDADSRIHIGAPADTRRSRFVLTVARPVRFSSDSLARLIATVDTTDVGRIVLDHDGITVATLVTSRALARGRRWSDALDTDAELLVDRLFGSRRCDTDEFGIEIIERNPRLSW